MVDERRSGSVDDVHDDDELAAAMAAEFERFATGAVPVIRPDDPPVRRSAPPARDVSAPPLEPAVPPGGEVSGPPADAPFRRRPVEPYVPPPSATPPTGPIRRRSGFLHPDPPADLPPVDPAERVLPTVPTPLPEATASLLDSMIAESEGEPVRRPRARHAEPVALPVTEIDDPLRATGPLALPPRMYEDWEQSLRSIGRPRDEWDDGEVVTGSGADAPTVAVSVVRNPAREATPPADAAVDLDALHASGPVDGDWSRRARRRTSEVEVVPPAETVPEAHPDDASDAEVDEVETVHPQVSAATTGAVEVPATSPRPRTAPVLIERVRTAILQLPTPVPSANGSGGAAVVGRWLGAFASPVALLLGSGLAAAGVGVAGFAAAVIGLVLALPAASRAAGRATALDDATSLEREVLGAAAPAGAVLLLLARIAATAASLLAVGQVVSAFAGRTGVLGGSVSASAIAGVLATGLLAVLVAVWPPRVTGALVLVLGGIGVVVTALLLLFLGQPGTAIPATPAGAAAGAGGGFGVIGLLLVLVGPDVARWRTAVVRARAAIVGTVAAGVVAVVVLAAAVNAGGGATGDAADAFAGAVADSTAAPLALPLAVMLIAASATLPAVLMRSAGGAAARLFGRGRSERLGALATGLLGLAGALAVIATGADPGDVLLVIAATAGVPVAAWAGALTAARFGGGGSTAAGAGVLVATVLGWLLADHVGVAAERSPVLTAVGSTPWGASPLLGLAVAFLVGVVSAAIARVGAGQASADHDDADILTR